MIDADVVIVGAGPTGLMLAIELCVAGVRPLVLERHPHFRDTPKAGGLSGQIVEVLRYRGLLERFKAVSTLFSPATRLPFGGLHVDFTAFAVPPMHLLMLPQPQIERLLDVIARELGAEIRRGHELTGLCQNDTAVVANVRAPGESYSVTARYLVGCDGAYSRVRDLAEIAFPGMTYPEVNRLAQVTIPDRVLVLDNGDIEVAGVGKIAFGYTQTEGGLFALGSTDRAIMGLFTSEEESTVYNDDERMTVDELRASVRRVLGIDLPMGEPVRLTRFSFHARQAERYRDGRIMVAGDAAHLFPAGGVALNAGMMDSVNLGWKLAAAILGWAPPGLLDTYHDERRSAGERTLLHTRAQVALRRGHDPAAAALRDLFAELLVDEQPLRRIGAFIAGTDIRYPASGSSQHELTGRFALDLPLCTAAGSAGVAELIQANRGVLLDLADRRDLRESAQQWRHRIDMQTMEAGDRPADALLIRPDGQIAWAAMIDEPEAGASPALREALSRWFGTA